jgi:hypothetical protein
VLWCPFNTPAIAVGVGGGGFHYGIRSVGVGAQPLKQQSGAFRRWVHCACARRLATRRRSPQCAPDSEVIGPMPMHLAMHLPQGPTARSRHAVARRIALSSGRALSFGSTGPGVRGSRLRLLRRRRCARLGGTKLVYTGRRGGHGSSGRIPDYTRRTPLMPVP